MKPVAPRMSRYAIGNLIESMDVMDATRNHELTPYSRLRSRHESRRVLRAVVASFAGVATLAAILGAM